MVEVMSSAIVITLTYQVKKPALLTDSGFVVEEPEKGVDVDARAG